MGRYISRTQVNVAEVLEFRASPPVMVAALRFLPVGAGVTSNSELVTIDAGDERKCERSPLHNVCDPLDEAVPDNGPREFVFPTPVACSDASPVLVSIDCIAAAVRFTCTLVPAAGE